MRTLSKRLQEREKILGLSVRTLAERATESGAPIHRATIYRYLNDHGAKMPTERTVRGLASAFGMSEQEIRELSGMPRGELGPWRPPEESARLSRDERAVLELLIRAFVRGGAGKVAEALPMGTENLTGNDTPTLLDVPRRVGEDEPRTRQARGQSRRRPTKDVSTHAPNAAEDAHPRP